MPHLIKLFLRERDLVKLEESDVEEVMGAKHFKEEPSRMKRAGKMSKGEKEVEEKGSASQGSLVAN